MPVSDTNNGSLNDLLEAFGRLGRFKKFFFPKTLKRALRALQLKLEDPSYTISTEDGKNICLAFQRATGFKKALFSCLSAFEQSPLMQAFSDLEYDKLLKGSYREEYLSAIIESEVPYGVSLAIIGQHNQGILRTGEDSFVLANLHTISQSKNPIRAAGALIKCNILQFLNGRFNRLVRQCISMYEGSHLIPNILQTLCRHGLLNEENIQKIITKNNEDLISFLWEFDAFHPMVMGSNIVADNQFIFDTIMNAEHDKLYFVISIIKFLHREGIYLDQNLATCILESQRKDELFFADELAGLHKAGFFKGEQAQENVEKIINFGDHPTSRKALSVAVNPRFFDENYQRENLDLLFEASQSLSRVEMIQYVFIWKEQRAFQDIRQLTSAEEIERRQQYNQCLFKVLLKLSETRAGMKVNDTMGNWLMFSEEGRFLLWRALQSQHGLSLLYGATNTFWNSGLLIRDQAKKYETCRSICDIAARSETLDEGKDALEALKSELSDEQTGAGRNRLFQDAPPPARRGPNLPFDHLGPGP